jgi:hypothetical protein
VSLPLEPRRLLALLPARDGSGEIEEGGTGERRMRRWAGAGGGSIVPDMVRRCGWDELVGHRIVFMAAFRKKTGACPVVAYMNR